MLGGMNGRAAPSFDFGRKLLRTREAAELLSLSARHLEDLRLKGGGPRFVRLGARAVRYAPADLASWCRARLATSTSDPGPGGGDAA
jgi:predicted DNA-binding transcriptional regulator AlpA